jgi:hypothetical protein
MLGYLWFADKVLFNYISEWHPLLTPYLYVDPKTAVQADILCTNEVLYQGTVSQYFLKDGQLSGIFFAGRDGSTAMATWTPRSPAGVP